MGFPSAATSNQTFKRAHEAATPPYIGPSDDISWPPGEPPKLRRAATRPADSVPPPEQVGAG
jgi:hypothetical protein